VGLAEGIGDEIAAGLGAEYTGSFNPGMMRWEEHVHMQWGRCTHDRQGS
jgi:hypothetical protein